MSVEETSEKRRYSRYPNCSAIVQVARRGLGAIFRANPQSECINFSRTGMQFDCDRELLEGERVVVDIVMDDISLQELKAEVVSRNPLATGWSYGARFCFEDPAMNHDRIYHDLLLIEETLKARQNLP